MPHLLEKITTTWQRILEDVFKAYRPEQHYMRGPGPKWHEKHADEQDAAQVTIRSRKLRPCRSSTSTIHKSGSKRSCFCRYVSASASAAGCCFRQATNARSTGCASSNAVCGAGPKR